MKLNLFRELNAKWDVELGKYRNCLDQIENNIRSRFIINLFCSIYGTSDIDIANDPLIQT